MGSAKIRDYDKMIKILNRIIDKVQFAAELAGQRKKELEIRMGEMPSGYVVNITELEEVSRGQRMRCDRGMFMLLFVVCYVQF